ETIPERRGDLERGPHALLEGQPSDGFPEHVLERLTPLGQPELATLTPVWAQAPTNSLNRVRHDTAAWERHNAYHGSDLDLRVPRWRVFSASITTLFSASGR